MKKLVQPVLTPAALASARAHRKEPILVRHTGALCALVRNGRQVRRSWDEVANLLEAEGHGNWTSGRALSLAVKAAS